MGLVTCRECKKQISSSAKTCPQCGAKQRRTSWVTWSILVLIVWATIQGVWSSMEKRKADEAKAVADAQALKQRQQAASEATAKLKTDCVTRRAALLDEFQSQIAKKKFDDAWRGLDPCARATNDAGLKKLVDGARIADLRGTAEDKSQPTANRLASLSALQRDYAKEFTAADEQLQSSLTKAQVAKDAAEQKKKDSEARRLYAQLLEKQFIERRMNTDVTTSGRENTTLRIKWVLTSKVTANDLQKSGVIEQARAAGFKRVEMTDGYDETFYWDL